MYSPFMRFDSTVTTMKKLKLPTTMALGGYLICQNITARLKYILGRFIKKINKKRIYDNKYKRIMY